MKDWKVKSNWSLFLDRDGVINERIMGGYVQHVDEFHFAGNAAASIAKLSQFFQHTFVVTNQQGIGKGIMTECNLLDVHNYMVDEVRKCGGTITKIFHAPELKNDVNSTRKPGPQMANKAKAEFQEVLYVQSIMVGDTDSDILFGKNLGMKTVRISGPDPVNVEADIQFDSLDLFTESLFNSL